MDEDEQYLELIKEHSDLYAYVISRLLITEKERREAILNKRGIDKRDLYSHQCETKPKLIN